MMSSHLSTLGCLSCRAAGSGGLNVSRTPLCRSLWRAGGLSATWRRHPRSGLRPGSTPPRLVGKMSPSRVRRLLRPLPRNWLFMMIARPGRMFLHHALHFVVAQIVADLVHYELLAFAVEPDFA